MLFVIVGGIMLGETAFTSFLIGRGYCWESGIVNLAAGMIIGCLVTVYASNGGRRRFVGRRNEEACAMGLSLWTSSSPLGEWLLIPGGFGSPPVAHAFIPSNKSEGFASEPAIEWRGSVAATGVRDVAKKSLTLVANSECACEIWADESTPTPEPRTFKLDTADGIVGYVGEWSSRANVSLSISRASDGFPMIYVWGTVRDAADAEATDEVGVKLDRRLIETGGDDLVRDCFSYTLGPVAQSSRFGEFVNEFRKRALA